MGLDIGPIGPYVKALQGLIKATKRPDRALQLILLVPYKLAPSGLNCMQNVLNDSNLYTIRARRALLYADLLPIGLF